MKGKIYHVSTTPNLTVLEPRVSSHGKPYVYGTPYLSAALLFGSKKSHGDLDGKYGAIGSKPFFYEAYPDAFKQRFEGESCYIYELDPTDFEEGKTNWAAEVVSEKPVKALKCTKVDDLYKVLLKLIEKGEISFYPYSNDKGYQKMMNQHLESRLIPFLKMISQYPEYETFDVYKFCKEKFPQWVEKFENEKKSTI